MALTTTPASPKTVSAPAGPAPAIVQLKTAAPANLGQPVIKKPGPKPTPKGASRRKVAAAKGSREGLDLERMARRLEADWRAAVERHQQVIQKQFHELRAALHVKPGKAKAAIVKDADKFRKALDAKLKPKRGRAKDLKRVELALGKALSHLNPK